MGLYMSPSRGPCADFLLSLCKSTNIVVNINTAKSYKKAKSNLLAGEKGHQHRDRGSCLVIHLYYRFIEKAL